MANKIFQPNKDTLTKRNIPTSTFWINKDTLIKQTSCSENEITEFNESEVKNPIFAIGHEDEIAKWTWDNAELTENNLLSPVPGSKVGSKVFCLGDKTILAIKTNKRIVLKFFNRSTHNVNNLYDSNLYDLWVYDENDPAFAA